ncbi:hypothetical protein GCM10010145_09780 [Streptomyces ruber]|uniref:Tetracyclin repressor-like C-terminal domain-containing protein n=2 Tax=Streptomyces TaxID=1883 RepID=A0A918B8H1_9ACTN|nr:hypothetical protein GCM10010145_09780 [Streptomyces ruber]
MPDRGSPAADVEGVVLQFAALLARPETRCGLMGVVAESARDDALRERIRASIVGPRKRLVAEGRARARARGGLPPGKDPRTAARDSDLVLDMVAGAVVHRCLAGSEPVDPAWVRSLTRVLLPGIAGTAQNPAGSV